MTQGVPEDRAESADAAIDWCVYVGGYCTKQHTHRGKPAMDASAVSVKQFDVVANGDGEMEIQCHAFGQGCWWSADLPNGVTIQELIDLATAHIAEKHVPTITIEPSEAR